VGLVLWLTSHEVSKQSNWLSWKHMCKPRLWKNDWKIVPLHSNWNILLQLMLSTPMPSHKLPLKYSYNLLEACRTQQSFHLELCTSYYSTRVSVFNHGHWSRVQTMFSCFCVLPSSFNGHYISTLWTYYSQCVWNLFN
jgi:hypothetical protein